jgi:hypothetical protein
MRRRWWLYERSRIESYRKIFHFSRVLGISAQANKYVAFDWLNPRAVFFYSLAIAGSDSDSMFGVLHSSLYESWVRFYTSKNLLLIRVSLADCFETFPFCEPTQALDESSRAFQFQRKHVLDERQIGLTEFYNLLHNPAEKSDDMEISRLTQTRLDIAVAAAYGWSNLDLGHGFHETKQGLRYSISESARCTVLDRLLALNHQRYDEEVKAGLHQKKAKKSPRRVYETETVETPLAAEQSELFNNKS